MGLTSSLSLTQGEGANDKMVTLGGFLKKNAINFKKLNVDMLNVQADASMYERFDLFKDSYNLLGNKQLRSLLMRPDNFMGGRYFAELIKNKVFKQMERDQYTFAENRISVYGKRRNEWSQLAKWFHIHGMGCSHNKWMVQIPRAFPGLLDKVGNFQVCAIHHCEGCGACSTTRCPCSLGHATRKT